MSWSWAILSAVITFFAVGFTAEKPLKKEELTGIKDEKDKFVQEVKSKTLSARESGQLVKKSLSEGKDASISISAGDIDELASKFPEQKFYLQVPIFVKIEAVSHHKAVLPILPDITVLSLAADKKLD